MKIRLLRSLRRSYEFFYVKGEEKYIVFDNRTKEYVTAPDVPTLLHNLANEFYDDMSMAEHNLLCSLKERRTAMRAAQKKWSFYNNFIDCLEKDVFSGSEMGIKPL